MTRAELSKLVARANNPTVSRLAARSASIERRAMKGLADYQAKHAEADQLQALALETMKMARDAKRRGDVAESDSLANQAEAMLLAGEQLRQDAETIRVRIESMVDRESAKWKRSAAEFVASYRPQMVEHLDFRAPVFIVSGQGVGRTTKHRGPPSSGSTANADDSEGPESDPPAASSSGGFLDNELSDALRETWRKSWGDA